MVANLTLNISNWAPENKNVANDSWKVLVTCQMDNFPIAIGHVLMFEKHYLDNFFNYTFFSLHSHEQYKSYSS